MTVEYFKKTLQKIIKKMTEHSDIKEMIRQINKKRKVQSQ